MARLKRRIGKQVHWSPTANTAASVANNRICLALLRIYRAVALERDVDPGDMVQPLWPVICLEKTLLRSAMQKLHERQARTPEARESGRFLDLPEWLASSKRRNPAPPASTPEAEVLDALGHALRSDSPGFRPLFDAVESRLEQLVLHQRSRADKNVELLSSLLGLSAAEQGILSLSAAVEMSTFGSSPFSVISRATRQVQALQVAAQLDNEHVVRSALVSESALSRSGLRQNNGGILQDLEETLRLSRQGSALLSANARSPAQMAAIVLKRQAPARETGALDWPHLQIRKELLLRLLANTLKHKEAGVNVLLYGAPGTGKSEFAKCLVVEAGAQGFSIRDTDDEQASASRPERLADLALSQVFAPAGKSILVLDEAEDVFDADYNNPFVRVFGKKQDSKAWMNSLLESNTHPVIWISNKIDHIDPAYLRRFTYCLEFPTTPRAVRRKIAVQHLEPVGCSAAVIESIGSDEHVTPAMLASAARFARMASIKGRDVDLATRHVLTDHLKALGRDMPGIVPVRSTRFDTRYLNVKGQVQPEAVLAGLQRVGRGTLLLSGPPGTGKTQLAAEIATRLGRELVYKTASDINTMWFGESERNVAKMFTECDPKTEVLFLDEADTLLESRGTSGHRANVAVTAEFLRRIEAFEGVFVCATNHPRTLDSALMRRFAFRLGFEPLNATQREHMLCEIAMDWTPASGVPPPVLPAATRSRLAPLGQLTPGDFANVVKRIRALGLSPTLHQWIDELGMEHDTKPSATRTAIGFV